MLRYTELDLIDQLVDDATPEREVHDWARVIVEEVTHDQDHDPYGESECLASNDSVQNRERRDQQNKRNRARRDRPEPRPTEQSMLQRPSRRTRTQCNARGVVPMIQRRKQRSACS